MILLDESHGKRISSLSSSSTEFNFKQKHTILLSNLFGKILEKHGGLIL